MTDTSAPSGDNPFQQARLLTNERAQLFSRTAESLADSFVVELGRWLSDVVVTAGPVEQVNFSDLADGSNDLAVIKAQYQMTHGVIATDLVLALSIVAMMCGGAPNPPPDARPLSRLEMGVLDLVLTPCDGDHVGAVLRPLVSIHEMVEMAKLQARRPRRASLQIYPRTGQGEPEDLSREFSG